MLKGIINFSLKNKFIVLLGTLALEKVNDALFAHFLIGVTDVLCLDIPDIAHVVKDRFDLQNYCARHFIEHLICRQEQAKLFA